MGRVAFADIEKFQASARGFFKLENDRDTAQVRFLYKKIDDLDQDIFCVHRITVDGQPRYVNCLREGPNDPVSDCRFCQENWSRGVRMFLQIAVATEFDKKTKEDTAWEVKVWDRGPNFAKKIEGVFSRVRGDICGTMFEIERQGKKGDQQTDYGIFAVNTDGVELNDLPERKDLLGTVVMDKTFEEMDAFIETDQFPEEGDAEDDVRPRTRRGFAQEDEPSVPRARSTRAVKNESRPEPEPEEEEDAEPEEKPAPTTTSRRRRV